MTMVENGNMSTVVDSDLSSTAQSIVAYPTGPTNELRDVGRGRCRLQSNCLGK